MKACTKCKRTKELSQFNFKIKARNIYSSHCKECSNAYVRNHYLNNRNYYLDKAKRRNRIIRIQIKKYIWDYLIKHSCVDCGESDPVVLEFDHISNKIINISEMARDKYALSKIIEEIAKCEIRCANCHRRKTALQFGWFKDINASVA